MSIKIYCDSCKVQIPLTIISTNMIQTNGSTLKVERSFEGKQWDLCIDCTRIILSNMGLVEAAGNVGRLTPDEIEKLVKDSRICTHGAEEYTSPNGCSKCPTESTDS